MFPFCGSSFLVWIQSRSGGFFPDVLPRCFVQSVLQLFRFFCGGRANTISFTEGTYLNFAHPLEQKTALLTAVGHVLPPGIVSPTD